MKHNRTCRKAVIHSYRGRPLYRVLGFARKMGVKVQFIDNSNAFWRDTTSPDVDFCPFGLDLAVNWETRTLYLSRKDRHNFATVGGVIHELGHILATYEKVGSSTESDFLGWEWLVAKKCQVTKNWTSSMSNYIIGDFGQEFGKLSPLEKVRLLKKAVERGKKYGNISAVKEPLRVEQKRQALEIVTQGEGGNYA